jgi:hypothetical protein
MRLQSATVFASPETCWNKGAFCAAEFQGTLEWLRRGYDRILAAALLMVGADTQVGT